MYSWYCSKNPFHFHVCCVQKYQKNLVQRKIFNPHQNVTIRKKQVFTNTIKNNKAYLYLNYNMDLIPKQNYTFCCFYSENVFVRVLLYLCLFSSSKTTLVSKQVNTFAPLSPVVKIHSTIQVFKHFKFIFILEEHLKIYGQ